MVFLIMSRNKHQLKQKIIIQARIEHDGKVLLLRRRAADGDGLYEFPGGALEGHEQPEDALRRHLQHDIGVKQITEYYLSDAFSMLSAAEDDVNYLLLVYRIEYDEHASLTLGAAYDTFVWADAPALLSMPLRDSAQIILGMYDGMSDLNHTAPNTINDDKKSTKYLIYTDGGSRGNPGHSAAAYVIYRPDGAVLEQAGEYMGVTTNNQAEYRGVLLALERAHALGLSGIEFRIDSMLVVNQLNGIYAVKNRELWPINDRIKTLLAQMHDVRFVHVPREQNTVADGLVNATLDRRAIVAP